MVGEKGGQGRIHKGLIGVSELHGMEECPKQRFAGTKAQKHPHLPTYLGIIEYFGSKWLLLASAQ